MVFTLVLFSAPFSGGLFLAAPLHALHFHCTQVCNVHLTYDPHIHGAMFSSFLGVGQNVLVANHYRNAKGRGKIWGSREDSDYSTGHILTLWLCQNSELENGDL